MIDPPHSPSHLHLQAYDGLQLILPLYLSLFLLQIHIVLPPINASHNSPALYADTWLGSHGAGSVFGLHFDTVLDCNVSNYHNGRAQVQTWLVCVVACLRFEFFDISTSYYC